MMWLFAEFKFSNNQYILARSVNMRLNIDRIHSQSPTEHLIHKRHKMASTLGFSKSSSEWLNSPGFQYVCGVFFLKWSAWKLKRKSLMEEETCYIYNYDHLPGSSKRWFFKSLWHRFRAYYSVVNLHKIIEIFFWSSESRSVHLKLRHPEHRSPTGLCPESPDLLSLHTRLRVLQTWQPCKIFLRNKNTGGVKIK